MEGWFAYHGLMSVAIGDFGSISASDSLHEYSSTVCQLVCLCSVYEEA